MSELWWAREAACPDKQWREGFYIAKQPRGTEQVSLKRPKNEITNFVQRVSQMPAAER